jgi:hypothetical protein
VRKLADSSTGGYLVGTETALDINYFFHDLIMNLTALNKTLIRPRWQPNPPTMPASGTDWIAFGVQELEGDNSAYIQKKTVGADLIRHEFYAVLCSCYGVNGRDNARKLRDGLEIGQNREVMYTNNIGFITAGNIIHAPELINDVWYDRFDVELRFAREVKKAYNILDIAHASVYPIVVSIGGEDVNTQTVTIVTNS